MHRSARNNENGNEGKKNCMNKEKEGGGAVLTLHTQTRRKEAAGKNVCG